MLIRQENTADYEKVYKLIKEAFETAEYSDGTEQDLAQKLRKSKEFVPELSLVAEIDGEIVGHIMFTEIEPREFRALALAPLSVLPKFQRRGIGSALIEKAHKIAKTLGYNYSVVLGSEEYYPKFGYVKAEEFGIETPKDFPPENYMAVKLLEDAENISGKLYYAKEFGL